MKKILIIMTMLLCIAASAFAEDRTTKEIYNDPSIPKVTVTGDNLRLRTHPDIDGYIIAELKAGTVCKYMNKLDDKNGEDSWIYVILPDGNVGWVFSAYVKIED